MVIHRVVSEVVHLEGIEGVDGQHGLLRASDRGLRHRAVQPDSRPHSVRPGRVRGGIGRAWIGLDWIGRARGEEGFSNRSVEWQYDHGKCNGRKRESTVSCKREFISHAGAVPIQTIYVFTVSISQVGQRLIHEISFYILYFFHLMSTIDETLTHSFTFLPFSLSHFSSFSC